MNRVERTEIASLIRHEIREALAEFFGTGGLAQGSPSPDTAAMMALVERMKRPGPIGGPALPDPEWQPLSQTEHDRIRALSREQLQAEIDASATCRATPQPPTGRRDRPGSLTRRKR